MNVISKFIIDSKTSRIRSFWRGHLFLFDTPQATIYSAETGSKLLLVFLLLESVVRRLFLAGARWLTIAARRWWPLLQMIALTLLVCWLVRTFAGVRLSELGLFPWRKWSTTEKFYLLQIVPLTITVFGFFVSASLKVLWSRHNMWEIGLFVFVPKMGFLPGVTVSRHIAD